MKDERHLKFTNHKVLDAVLKTAVNGIIIINDKGIILSFNPAAGKAFNYQPNEVVGKNVSMLMPNAFAKNHDKYLQRFLKTKIPHIIGTGRELQGVRKDGSKFPLWLSVSSAIVRGKHIFAGIIEDISDKKAAAKKLNYISQHDSITELLNYYAFTKELSSTLSENQKNVLLLIKINNFSDIQNTYGLWISNKLLKELAKKLASCLRSEDEIIRKTNGDLLSYLGNATFSVLFFDMKNMMKNVEHIAQRIINQIAMPLNIESQIVYPNASIGISEPYEGDDYIEIFKSADIALSLAIQTRNNNFCNFSPEYKIQFIRSTSIAQLIHSAMLQDEFYLVYQPQINIKTKKIVGMEVLVRWENSSLGQVMPDEFIPIAIREGLMSEIDRRTLEKACAQLARWKKLGFISKCCFSINVLPDQLLSSDFTKAVKRLIKKNDLKAKDLEFEFLEANLMGDIKSVIPVLNELNELGIGLAIDDFGTGHSSLSRLSLLPMKILKIDRSFVLGIGSHESESIIKIIMQLANLLKLEVIAEGVETKDQLNFLTKLNCQTIQGYYFSKALKAKEMTQLLGDPKSFHKKHN